MRKKKKFNEFINKTIEELKEEKRYSTAHIYQSTLNTFCEFCGCKVVYFHQLNRANLKEFETYLRNKQLSWNTVSTYMRTLRGAYNKAVDQRITAENSRLFNHVYTGVKNNIKRALEVEEINKLLNEIPLKKLSKELIQCRVWANLMFRLHGKQVSEYQSELSLPFPYPQRKYKRRRAVYRVPTGTTNHEL